MHLNPRFIAHGVIVTLVFMTVTSALDDITRLAIVIGLCAAAVLIERAVAKQ